MPVAGLPMVYFHVGKTCLPQALALTAPIARILDMLKIELTAMSLDEETTLSIAVKAVQLYAESHPRPVQVTQTQAAEMLGLSRPTVSKLLKFGTFRLNRCGMIPIEQVDRALKVQ